MLLNSTQRRTSTQYDPRWEWSEMNSRPVVFTGEFMVPGGCNKWTEANHYARYDFASDYVAGKDVLDIACGVGYGTAALARAGARSVEGVDIRSENIDYAREKYSAENLSFKCGDVTSYGETASYDVIVCFETIEHIPCFYAALENFRRILRNGGVLLVSSPNRLLSSPRARWVTDPPENKFHVREFTESELLLLLEAVGFQVSQSDIFGQAYQLLLPHVVLTKGLRKCLIRPFGNSVVYQRRNTLLKPNYFVLRARKTLRNGSE